MSNAKLLEQLIQTAYLADYITSLGARFMQERIDVGHMTASDAISQLCEAREANADDIRFEFDLRFCKLASQLQSDCQLG